MAVITGQAISLGSSGGLSFNVKGNLIEPSNPKENDIWVVTETPITSWEMGDEPSQPYTEGQVFIELGSISDAPMDALKGNKSSLTIYPTRCLQYVNGAWVGKMAKTYLNGIWVAWKLWLFKEGTGFQARCDVYEGTNSTFHRHFMTKNALKWAYTNNPGNNMNFTPALELTSYNTLVIDLMCGERQSSNVDLTIGVGDDQVRDVAMSGNFSKSIDIWDTTRKEHRIDISELKGGPFFVKMHGYYTTGYIYNCWFE